MRYYMMLSTIRDGLILKLDFEKAYDKMSWEFLFEMLRQRGFNET
jgi:hypothetical protein